MTIREVMEETQGRSGTVFVYDKEDHLMAMWVGTTVRPISESECARYPILAAIEKLECARYEVVEWVPLGGEGEGETVH